MKPGQFATTNSNFFHFRFCVNCQTQRRSEDGRFFTSKCGRTRRWKCDVCIERARVRADAPALAA